MQHFKVETTHRAASPVNSFLCSHSMNYYIAIRMIDTVVSIHMYSIKKKDSFVCFTFVKYSYMHINIVEYYPAI